jgi:TPP-dependent indolepyruvate ferredoxin oxidoreductase alpha subunit
MVISDLIAQALIDANVNVINYVPGYGGTAIYKALAQKRGNAGFISFHEEVAYTIAHGASLVGTRSALLCKTHGIMKAANSLSDSLQCGTTAGMVVIIPEDKGGTHSDTIIETKPFLDGIGMPNFWSSPEKIYDDIHRVYELSEKYRLPWGIIIDADDINHNNPYIPRYAKPSPPYSRDVVQHVLCPLFNPYQRIVYDAKMKDKSWQSLPKPQIPTIPEGTSENWKKAVKRYEPFFSIYKKFRGDIVTGETGISSQFCANPWHCIDIVTYMGGSIPLAMGASLAGRKNVWAITGDFSFISAGPLALIEARLRDLPLNVVILDNGKAVTTGGQEVASGALDLCLAPYREQVIGIVNPHDSSQLEQAFETMTNSNTLKILVVNYRDTD